MIIDIAQGLNSNHKVQSSKDKALAQLAKFVVSKGTYHKVQCSMFKLQS